MHYRIKFLNFIQFVGCPERFINRNGITTVPYLCFFGVRPNKNRANTSP